jgi:hypothetical protein
MAGDITINIIAAFIWLLIGAASVRLWSFIKNRRINGFHRFTGIVPDTKLVHLVYGLVEKTREGPAYSVEEGDVAALCASLSFLERRFGVTQVCAINSHAARTTFSSYQSIVSISGPIWNEISRFFLDKFDLPAKYRERTINGQKTDVLELNVDGKKTQFRTLYSDGTPRECYSLVVSGIAAEGLGSQRRQVFTVVSGISPLGTFGGVHWLRQLEQNRHNDFAKKSTPRSFNKWSCAVLKVTDNSPKGFRCYASEVDTPGFLKLELVKYVQADDLRTT